MNLTSITIRNFKAIREAEVSLADYTVIIGRNDVGKSSVLEAIDMFLNFDTPDKSDFHHRDDSNTITIHGEFEDPPDELTEAMSDDYTSDGSDLEVTVRHESPGGRNPSSVEVNGEELEAGAIVKEDGEEDEYTMSESRDFIQDFLSDTVPVFAERDYSDETDLKRGSFLTKLMGPVFTSDAIDDKKQEIKEEIESESQEIGIEINRVLSEQHPTINNVRIDVADFDLSNAVTPEVEVRDGVTEDWMTLSDRGSGVGNQFILSMMKAYAESQIGEYCVLFEEPENSLHPSAVREMGNALKEISQQEGQVVITTHSPVLIDHHGDGNLIVASNSNGLAEFERLGEEKFQAIETIGAKNSDILQSDYVLYTEGASDAVILEVICENEFQNWGGHNITIQPAGGSNLEHQLENMKEINRNSGILIDSDRRSEGGELGGQAARLRELAEEHSVDYWITNHSEIESYFDTHVIEDVLDTSGVSFGRYEAVEEYLRENHGYAEGEKVANAREITQKMFERGLDNEFDEIKGYLREVVERVES